MSTRETSTARFWRKENPREVQGGQFPPRTVGLWFEEGVIDEFSETIETADAMRFRELT
ncbi:MAG: hypothetical protein ACE5KV_04410 [Thermoplasmata archaeon]